MALYFPEAMIATSEKVLWMCHIPPRTSPVRISDLMAVIYLWWQGNATHFFKLN